jgi:hypothetical protein
MDPGLCFFFPCYFVCSRTKVSRHSYSWEQLVQALQMIFYIQNTLHETNVVVEYGPVYY